MSNKLVFSIGVAAISAFVALSSGNAVAGGNGKQCIMFKSNVQNSVRSIGCCSAADKSSNQSGTTGRGKAGGSCGGGDVAYSLGEGSSNGSSYVQSRQKVDVVVVTTTVTVAY